MGPIVRHLRTWTSRLLTAIGVVAIAVFLWLLSGMPLGLDSWLNVARGPTAADAIVCIGGGTMDYDLPTGEGWTRIYTSVQLFADGYAPIVIFTGRGNARVSEAEIYQEAALWFGLPREASRLDPLAASTAEHPDTVLKSLEGRITRDSRLLLVTSPLHARRVLMTFRKHGFTNVSVVSHHRASKRLAEDTRRSRSTLPTYTRDDKQYTDAFFRLRSRSQALFTALRELAAIAVYRWRGEA